MGRGCQHATRKPTVWRWLTALATASVAAAAVVMVTAYVATADSAAGHAAPSSWPNDRPAPGSVKKAATLAIASSGQLGLAPKTAATRLVSGPLALPARDARACPSAAAACVDLARHLTWLQSGGRVTFGPVRMEPGPPRSPNSTPRGTFTVIWKGGPNVVSNVFNEAMPWAVQFTSDGVAFHAGSLTAPSHGCVHLTMANAHYYNQHLAIGAEVAVF
jgi:lipoprotein-anchoring transpeptidase ErfK/SrfK